MMPSNYVSRDGGLKEFDLDAVIDVINGWSQIRSGWQGFVVYLPSEGRFIELMSAVPDVRGNSDDQAAEVDAAYVQATYGLTADQLSRLQSLPSQWVFIKQR